MGFGKNKKIILGLFMTTVFAAVLACGAAEVTPAAAPAAPAVAPAPAPVAPAPAAQQPAAPAPAAPAAAPAPATAATPAPVAVTKPAVQIETKAVESSGLTFWSDLAAQCVKRGGHIRLGNRVSEFTNLNPPTINQVIQFSISAEVLSGLVQLDPLLRPAADLAESWSVSDDLLKYTFKLRENAKYHSGRQFTADDVVFTYDNQLDPDTQSIHTKGLEGVNRPVKIDDFTVEISSAFPRASFLTKVVERASGRVMTLVDKESIAELGQGGYNRMPVGVGPFKITDHFFGERLVLEAARDTYYDPSVPCVDKVTHFNIPEFNTLIASLSTGQVDMIYGFAPQFWDQLEETDGIIVDTTPDVGFQMIAFNRRGDRAAKIGIESAPWDNQEIVYAIGNALDREKFIARAFQGRAIPAYGAIPPGEKFYFRDLSATSRKAFDLPLAKKRMADNGFADGFEVKIMTTPENKVVLEVLGALLKEAINVTLIPDIVESSVYQPRRAAGEWEGFLGGSGGDPDPDDAIDDWFADGAKFNTYGYNDEVVNRLNLKQKASVDINKRLEFILQISDRMDETFGGVFTHHRVQRTAYRDYVKGYVWIHALRQLSAVWLDN